MWLYKSARHLQNSFYTIVVSGSVFFVGKRRSDEAGLYNWSIYEERVCVRARVTACVSMSKCAWECLWVCVCVCVCVCVWLSFFERLCVGGYDHIFLYSKDFCSKRTFSWYNKFNLILIWIKVNLFFRKKMFSFLLILAPANKVMSKSRIKARK